MFYVWQSHFFRAAFLGIDLNPCKNTTPRKISRTRCWHHLDPGSCPKMHQVNSGSFSSVLWEKSGLIAFQIVQTGCKMGQLMVTSHPSLFIPRCVCARVLTALALGFSWQEELCRAPCEPRASQKAAIPAGEKCMCAWGEMD